MSEQNSFKKYIDIPKVMAESTSPILGKMPKFAVRIISKVVYQNELNGILNRTKNAIGVDFLPAVLKEFNLKVEIIGKENLPENGKCFFASNHPFGIADGMVLTHTIAAKYGDLKAIANDAFMFMPQMHPIVAAVNVFGRSPKEYIVALDEVYHSDVPITHFPAGRVSRKENGKVVDLPWQKSFITKSISSQRDIVPFYFYGRNSRLFYAVYTFRKFFGIKVNMELALLPHEMFNKRNKTIKLRIGKPISYTKFDKSLSHLEWAQKVRAHVYSLGENKPEAEFQ